MFDAFLKPDELQEIAEKLGADVPFCLVGGTKYATGIGTKLQKMPNFWHRILLSANLIM